MINFNFLYLSLFCNFAWWNINMPLFSFRFVLYFFGIFALIQHFNSNIFIFFNSTTMVENLSLLPTSLLAQLEEYCEYLLLECAWGLKLFTGSILTGNANYYVISSFLDTMYINHLLALIINNSVTQDELNWLLFEVQKINYLFNFFNIDTLLYESFGLDKEYFFKDNLSKKNPKPSPSTAFEQIIFFRDLLVPQLFFVEIALFFFKKKIIIFFITNFFLVIAMLWNLTKLCNSLNLIYALLHFLFFAVLSGIMIILWGSLYIGLCVLLIYGAAIPVLALYIIMLVNVDLIQRLFFFEYISSASLTNKFKTILFFLFLSLFFFFLCKYKYFYVCC